MTSMTDQGTGMEVGGEMTKRVVGNEVMENRYTSDMRTAGVSHPLQEKHLHG